MQEDEYYQAERQEFGNAVRLYRTGAGLKQSELAERMAERGFPWHGSTVSKTETGDRDPSLTEIYALAGIFQKPASYFLRSQATRAWLRRERLLLVEELEGEIQEATAGYEEREREIAALQESNQQTLERIARLQRSLAEHSSFLEFEDAEGNFDPEQEETNAADS